MKKIVFILVVLILSSCTNMKKIVRTNHSNLPTPIGPYSHSIAYNDLIFVSGQIRNRPKDKCFKRRNSSTNRSDF